MADENTPVEDNAGAAQGATEADMDPATQGGGNPAPAEPPKNKAEADAAQKAEDTPEDTKEGETPEDDAADPDKQEDDDTSENDDDKPLDQDVWGTTGDEVGDNVLALLQNSGLSVDDAKSLMYDAVQGGDVTKIDRAALEARVGKRNASLIMAGTENFIHRNTKKAETILNEVHTSVGGKDNWDAVTSWARESLSEAELTGYRELIDAGGAKARFAAQDLANRFNGDSKNTTLNTSDAEITGDSRAASQSTALTKAQYIEAMTAADKRGATPTEIAEIRAARQRGRAKGI